MLSFIKASFNYLKKGQFSNYLRYLNEYLYAITHYSTEGNLDIEEPSPHLDITNLKIAVYTCIVGHYDDLSEPLFMDSGVDYYLFTDIDSPTCSGWKKIDITQFEEYNELSSSQLSRKIKMLPYLYLPDYDYTIYVDGNIQIVDSMSSLIEEMGNHAFGVHYHRSRDCIYDELVRVIYLRKNDVVLAKQQVKAYKQDGFPRHYGLYENSVLIRKHNDKDTFHLMEEWWYEYFKYSTRDQLSLPYLIWKLGYDKKKIHIMGRNLYKNPKFHRTHSHDK